MDLKEQETRGSYRWLICAGGLAVALSVALFISDYRVMGGAADRDREHAREMNQLRVAQSSLPGRVTDPRQILPLTIEAENHEQSGHDAH